jgi:hypothetical protein
VKKEREMIGLNGNIDGIIEELFEKESHVWSYENSPPRDNPIIHTLSGLLRQMAPSLEASLMAKSYSDDARRQAEEAIGVANKAKLAVSKIEQAAKQAASAAERALPHILTVMTILIAAVIAIVCVYLSTILNRISELEGTFVASTVNKFLYASHRQLAFTQMLFLGQVVINTVWVFIYLCSNMIERLRRTPDKDNDKDSDNGKDNSNDKKGESYFPGTFKAFIIGINVLFIALYILARLAPWLIFV